MNVQLCYGKSVTETQLCNSDCTVVCAEYVLTALLVFSGYGFVDFDSPAAAQKAVTALKTTGVQAQMAKARIYDRLILTSNTYKSPTNTAVLCPAGQALKT